MDRQCDQAKYFNAFRATSRTLGLPLGLVASSRLVEQQINLMHYFMWKNALKLSQSPTTLPAPGPTIPHTFKVKTEKGIETRSSYNTNDFVNVVALLAEELSEFLDYWNNIPKFVEEDVSQSGTSLRDELEVLFVLISQLPIIYIASSIASNVFEPATCCIQMKSHKGICTIFAVSLVRKSPHLVKHSVTLSKSVRRQSGLLRNIEGSISAICQQLQLSSVL